MADAPHHWRRPATGELDPDVERRLAIDLFNRTWHLLGLGDERTPEDDDELLRASHASAHHWSVVGEPVHNARGAWMCSRVAAVLGDGIAARHWGERSLEWCGRGPVDAFDVPFAHEALARAAMVLDDAEDCERHLLAARALLSEIEDPDDRAIVEADLASIEVRGA